MAAPKKKTEVKKAAPAKAKVVAKSPAKGGDIYSRLASKLSTGQGGKNTFWKPPSGNSVIRVFPFEHDGQEEVVAIDKRHWNLETGEGEAKFLQCGGEDCPLCALKGEVSDETWDSIGPRETFMVNAVIRKSPEHGGKDTQVIAQLNKTTWGWYNAENPAKSKGIVSFIAGDEPDVPEAFDLKVGRDFKITKSGKGRFDTSYKVLPSMNPSAVGVSVTPVDLLAKVKAPNMEALQAAADAIAHSD